MPETPRSPTTPPPAAGPAAPPAATPPRTLAGPKLSPNVPQEISHSGQHYIELRLAPTDFIATARAAAAKGGQR